MKTTTGILTAALLLTSTTAFAGSSLIGVSTTVISSVRVQVGQPGTGMATSVERNGRAGDGKYRIVFAEQDTAADSRFAVVTLLTDERLPSRR
jgi:hypothetical protein